MTARLQCARCQVVKPKSEKHFGKSLRNKSGYRSYCRACDSAATKTSRLKNLVPSSEIKVSQEMLKYVVLQETL